MKSQNLAKLPKEEMDKINLHRQVCLARYVCKGKSKYEINEYLKTIDSATADHIRGLMRDKK